MSRKVFQKPYIEKVEFGAKEVIATSGVTCYGSVMNVYEGTQGSYNCTSGTPIYEGWNSASIKPDWYLG